MKIYRQLVKFITYVISINIIWKLLIPFVKFFDLLKIKRDQVETSRLIKEYNLESYFKDKEVLSGAFKGLKYPRLQSIGGLIYPKLLGTYEKELHPVIEEIKSVNYDQIIDVGCAEGYYAVGFGKLFPKTLVRAYDIDAEARKLCAEMSEVNQVSNVEVMGLCDPKTLKALDSKSRTLIISDCEGYEKILFNDENLEQLRNADILIETHDFLDIEISDYLKNLFSTTHHMTSIKSIDDIQKAHQYSSVIDNLPLKVKSAVYAEGRPGTMEWLFFKPLEN